jgi:hypothetical protein
MQRRTFHPVKRNGRYVIEGMPKLERMPKPTEPPLLDIIEIGEPFRDPFPWRLPHLVVVICAVLLLCYLLWSVGVWMASEAPPMAGQKSERLSPAELQR